jgi:hypothetical protein
MNQRTLLGPSLDKPPLLTFAPLAWLKLQFFCHAGDTEIGGFGVAAAGNPLYVNDFVTVAQEATPFSVRFSDEAVADYFDQAVDLGLKPDDFARVWLHTHPGASVTPSGTDEETFARCFGRCDWALMFILGRTSQTYARLAFHVGPGVQQLLPVAVDWPAWPQALAGLDGTLATVRERWQQEYAAHVQVQPNSSPAWLGFRLEELIEEHEWWDDRPWSPEVDAIFYEPVEKPEHEPVSQAPHA